MPNKPVVFETRTVTADFETREDGNTPTLEGYAATFGEPYDLGSFREQIHPTAFRRTLGTKPDVRLLIDHAGQPLARTKSGTLELSPDSRGLHVRARLDPTDPDVQRLLPKMRRGDLDQMSFAFRVPDGGDEWDDTYSMRTLRNVELNGGDVSVVTYPANPLTSVAVRARDTRAANLVLAEAMFRELRAGNPVDMLRLQHVLELVACADEAVDQAQPILADLLGVPNPDMDDEAGEAGMDDEAGEPRSAPAGVEIRETTGRPVTLALAQARALGVK